ncbi:putative serine protease PepD [Leucobacter luti]|uniref:trypsin-like peptidase domain-containing protein n=1 Tax=Leucobacter luti TaxID=340320 RepID=UPI0010D36D2E|nr:trypsin-like peptidase domain-containing protein [Leucobacter luti]MCW2287487.1 putative serine protease PepD [Leucobacter luti]TCK41709.1 putative serine protease PepD [Leucobacter luti]
MTTTPEHQNTDREDAPKQPVEGRAEAAFPAEASNTSGASNDQLPAAPQVPEFLAPEAVQPPAPHHPETAAPAAAAHPAAPAAQVAPAAAATTPPVAPTFTAPSAAAPTQDAPAAQAQAPQHVPGSAHPQNAGYVAAAPGSQPAHQPTANQPTVQLGDVSQAPGAAHGVAPGTPHNMGATPGQHHDASQPGAAFGAAPTAQATKDNHPKSRTGALLAGLAIGALLGGVVGGGVAAVVASNVSPQSVAQGNSAITLNNAENATAISGVAAVATPSVVTLEVASSTASGSGSGVIYSEDGYIVTNAHVVTLDGAALEGATVRVKLSDGRILDGNVVGVDPYADLAVVKVDATGLPAIKVADSDKLDVGDLTVAIGAPLNLANTVTSGVVSALNRGISVGSPLIPQDQAQQPDGQGDQGSEPSNPWDFRFGLPDGSEQQQQQQQQTTGGSVTLPVIQTDASINPGNSGGALLNGSGELIGINVAIASASASSGTAGSNGLGFAIPSNLAARVADAIIAGEQPSHGLLGASVADSSQDDDEDANHAGGLLVDVTKDGAAAKAGLKAGDVITAVDGVSAVDGTSVSALIRMHEGGSKITIDYTRGGKPGQVEATLGNLEW